MTLHRALVHLDMIDLFKAKCQPSVTSAQVLVWLKTFPKLVETVSYFPNADRLADLRKKCGCPAAWGGASLNRRRTGDTLVNRTTRTKLRPSSGVDSLPALSHRTPKRITEEWNGQPGDDF